MLRSQKKGGRERPPLIDVELAAISFDQPPLAESSLKSTTAGQPSLKHSWSAGFSSTALPAKAGL
jgi:hypothetical protein